MNIDTKVVNFDARQAELRVLCVLATRSARDSGQGSEPGGTAQRKATKELGYRDGWWFEIPEGMTLDIFVLKNREPQSKPDGFAQREEAEKLGYWDDPRWAEVKELRRADRQSEANGLTSKIRDSWGVD